MQNLLKDMIKQQLHNRCYEKYAKEVLRQSDAYTQWILQNETWKKQYRKKQKSQTTVTICAMQDFVPGFQIPDEDILVFVRDNGKLDTLASQVIADFYDANAQVKIAYTDEDCIDGEGLRHTPWFKPEWSPDTLHSFAYYGNVLTVRTETLRTIWGVPDKLELTRKGEQNVYRMFLCLAESFGEIPANSTNKPIADIDKVLFHREIEKNYILSDADAAYSDSIYEENDKPDLLYADLISEKHKETNQAAKGELKKGSCEDSDKELVSIIIPSKDQPDVLETCIASIRQFDSEDIRTEIIVVDNGSTAYNRLRVEEFVKKYNMRYFYKPMPFNFSIMCNMGAARAKGDFLLFLNDDMEVTQENWLECMLESARLPHVGAVGAKLLYPDSDLIQHVGVTNLAIGPAHKLLKLHDENVYYHGQNRHTYDMIGVTAACLMVEQDKFRKVDGFREELAVAYNDVDLCFTLYEQGFYNVQRNDVVLFHHESLSRGDDLLSDEKKERLLREKSVLYTKHPELKGYDPFYNRHLAGMKHMYLCDYQFEYEQENYYVRPVKWNKEEPLEWENNCLNITIEIAKLQDKHDLGEIPRGFHIEGWSYVLDMDNSHYDRQLLLIGDNDMIYEVDTICRNRRDVVRILPKQQNVELAGFVCRIPRGDILPGTYTIAMLAKDSCSKQQLYKKTATQLVVGD